ncbi:MAG: ATP-binding protein [Bacteroidetes bacterium]|nr:ATP-binding protein [Bacteroidota bacterium]
MSKLTHLSIGGKSWALSPNENMLIDCENITFFEPIGLLFLAGYFQNQMKISKVINFKANLGTLNYLERIGVLSFLDEEFGDRIVFDPPRPRMNRRPLRGNLIEFQVVNFNDRNELNENIRNLIFLCSERSAGKIPYEFIDDVFAELLDNIYRHSGENKYFVVAQAYIDRVKISISDTGIGIPGKIKPTFSEVKTDSEAIIKATEPGISSYPEGGWGLTTLKSYLEHIGEYLFIASNNGCVKFVHNRPYIYSNYSCEFTGTFIEICFRTDVIRTLEIEDNNLPF